MWQTPWQVQGLEGQSWPLKLKCQKCCKEFYCRNCNEKVYVQVCMRLYRGQWVGRKNFHVSSQSLNKAVAKGPHYNVAIVTKKDKLGVRSVVKWNILKILWQTLLPMGALCAKYKQQYMQLLFFAVFARKEFFFKVENIWNLSELQTAIWFFPGKKGFGWFLYQWKELKFFLSFRIQYDLPRLHVCDRST